jgi:hypothetical protein
LLGIETAVKGPLDGAAHSLPACVLSVVHVGYGVERLARGVGRTARGRGPWIRRLTNDVIPPVVHARCGDVAKDGRATCMYASDCDGWKEHRSD